MNQDTPSKNPSTTDARRASYRTSSAKWQAKNKVKLQCHKRVRIALARGDLIKGPCETCGGLIVDAHHDDYSKPLDVRWFCRPHHNAYHTRLRAVAKSTGRGLPIVPQNLLPPISRTLPPFLRRTLRWGRVLPLTNMRLNAIAQRYGVKCNKLGVVLDALIDSLENLEGLNIPPSPRHRVSERGRPGRLSAEQIKAIRLSKDKPISIATDHRISEALVRAIRRKTAYRWVK